MCLIFEEVLLYAFHFERSEKLNIMHGAKLKVYNILFMFRVKV
jgi:hypothetical protein